MGQRVALPVRTRHERSAGPPQASSHPLGGQAHCAVGAFMSAVPGGAPHEGATADARLALRVAQHLQRLHVATLATVGPDGPWAAAVFYAHDGWDLYFLSSPTSRHAVNLAHEARAAATIQADHADWPGIQGVQLEGTVQPLSGNAEARARDLYGQKFPLVGKLAQAPAAIVRALAKVRWYRLSTSRLYFIDNTRGFGHREELVLRVGAADT